MPGTRKQRLQESLRTELSDVIRREMRDPRFRNGLLSITEVEVTQDLKHATVYVSVLGNAEAQQEELKALRGASYVLREELKRRRVFINVPDLSFKYDDAIERGNQMFELLQRVKQEDEARPKPPEAEEAAEAEGTAEDAL